MRFNINQIILLGTEQYQIKERLGHGAVSDVYVAVPLTCPEVEVIIKLVRDDVDLDPLKVEGVRHEAEVLEKLNRAEDPHWVTLTDPIARLRRAQETRVEHKIIALLESGELDNGHPFVVQEQAPPAFERFSIEKLADEQRMLSVLQAVAEVIALAHQYDLSLKDFEPQTKWDRIRVQWLDDQNRFHLKLIDWNVTGGKDEKEQDLIFFGGHCYYFLLGQYLRLDVDNTLPVTLGIGMPGWEILTEGSRQILRRLSHRDPKRRYRQASEIVDDLTWWLETIRWAQEPRTSSRLQGRIWQVRPQGRHDRALAVAELALRFNLSSETRQSFELWANQAREELEKEDWQPIARARATLLTGAYDEAVDEFEHQLRILPINSEAARLARLFHRKALFCAQLKQTLYRGSDVQSTPMWNEITAGIDDLVKRHYEDAQQHLSEIIRLQPETASWLPIKDLLNQTQADAKRQYYFKKKDAIQFERIDINQPNWLELETKQISSLQDTIVELKEAQLLAPLEPEYQELWRVEQEQLERRHTSLPRYRKVMDSIAQGQQTERHIKLDDLVNSLKKAYQEAAPFYQTALTELQDILKIDPTQYKAHILQTHVQDLYEVARQVAQASGQIKNYLDQQDYRQALQITNQLVALVPNRLENALLISQIQFCIRLLDEAEQKLTEANLLLRTDGFGQVAPWLSELQSQHSRILSQLSGGENLPEEIGQIRFHFPKEIRDKITVQQQQLRVFQDVDNQVTTYQAQHNDAAIVTLLESIQTRYLLIPKHQQWLDKARQILTKRNKAADDLSQADNFDELRRLLSSLTDDPSPEATKLRNQVGDRWQQLTQTETDLDILLEYLSEGISLFQSLPMADTFVSMHQQVKLAQNVVKDLTLIKPARWPVWFTATDLSYHLHRLLDDLKVLRANQSWPTMQNLAYEYYRKLVNYLDNFQSNQLETARQQSRSAKFAVALATAKVARQLSTLLGDKLSCDEQLQKLIKAIQDRESIKEELDKILTELTEGKLPLEEAKKAITLSLPDNPDVPVVELKNLTKILQADLIRVENMYTAWKSRTNGLTSTTYATILEEYLNQVNVSFEKLPANVVKRVQNPWQEATQQVVLQLRLELQKAVRELEFQPLMSPDKLIHLYWQAFWWQIRSRTTSISAEPELPGALQKTRQLVGDLFDRAVAIFKAVRSRADLDQTQQLVFNLTVLYNGLIRPPTGLILPMLPPGAQYNHILSSLDGVALQQWAVEIETWQNLDDHLSSQLLLQPKSVQEAINIISSIQQTAQEFHRSLEQVKKSWLPLKVDWPKAGSLFQLEVENGAHLKLISAIQQATLPSYTQEAKVRLDKLIREIDQVEQELSRAGFSLQTTSEPVEKLPDMEQAQPFSIWLLAPQRQELKQALTLIHQDLGCQAKLAEARQASSQQRFPVARELFEQILELTPDNSEAQSGLNEINAKEVQEYMRVGQQALAKEDFQEAREAFQSALKVAPSNREAECYENIAHGRQVLIEKHFTEALNFFRYVLDIAPQNIEAEAKKWLIETFRRAGQASEQAKKLRQAEEYYQCVVNMSASESQTKAAQADLWRIRNLRAKYRRNWLIGLSGLLFSVIIIILAFVMNITILPRDLTPTQFVVMAPVIASTKTTLPSTLTPTNEATRTSTPTNEATRTSTPTNEATRTSTPTPTPIASPTLTPSSTLTPIPTQTPTPIVGQLQNEYIAVYPDPLTSTIKLIIPQGLKLYLCNRAADRYLVADSYCHDVSPLGWIFIKYIKTTEPFPEGLVTPMPTATLAPQPIQTVNKPELVPYPVLLNGNMENDDIKAQWICYDNCALISETETPHSGTKVLKVANRQKESTGPNQILPTNIITTNLISNGVKYETSVWVKLADPGTAKVVITLGMANTEPTQLDLTKPIEVTNREWTQVTGQGILEFKGRPTQAGWYVHTLDGNTFSFYIDDAEFIIQIPPETGK